MASGPVPLLIAAKYGKDQIAQGIVEVMIQESPLLEQLPWMTFAGTALQKKIEGSLPSVQFRKVNAGYSTSYGSNDKTFWGVAILGGEIKVDNFEVNVIGTEADIEADQYNKLAKANSMRFDYEFFNGDGTNDGFKGVKTLQGEGFGQALDNGTAAIDLDKLDEALDLFRNQGRPDAALCNRTHRRQITKAARTSVSGTVLIDVGTDVFGRKVNHYDDVPLRILGDALDASDNVVPALDFDEASSTSSLWFVKYGKDDVTGLMGKGGSFDVKRFGELQAQPQRMGRLEWYPGVAVFNKYSLVRLFGITAA